MPLVLSGQRLPKMDRSLVGAHVDRFHHRAIDHASVPYVNAVCVMRLWSGRLPSPRCVQTLWVVIGQPHTIVQRTRLEHVDFVHVLQARATEFARVCHFAIDMWRLLPCQVTSP